MAVIGAPRSYHKKFKFIVEFQGLSNTGFQKCSELSSEIADVQISEGGSLIPNKSPGRVTFADITLERGATKDHELFDWYKEVCDVAANTGLTDDNYKRDGAVVQQDRDGKTLRRWNVAGAWPKKLVVGEWDNEADENVIEQLTLAYDYFDLDEETAA